MRPQKLPAFVGDGLWFPNPESADSEGLVAFGGDLSVARLLLAYRSGLFPWTAEPATWWSPDPRGVIELEAFHVPRSLAKVLRRGEFTFTIDCAFEKVIRACAARAKGRRTTWISPEFIEAYCGLHRLGYAHSVECWLGKRLVGGVYGVAINGLFAGESMFHRADDASKAALYHLVCHLRARNFLLFDIQMLTPVTTALGGTPMPRAVYLERLRAAIAAERSFSDQNGKPIEN